jgi:hypothetical protein
LLASPTGVEPVTLPLGGARAIQLCHGEIATKYTEFSDLCPAGYIIITQIICISTAVVCTVVCTGFMLS